MKKILVAVSLAASLGSVAMPAAAQVYVEVAPPPPRFERVPPPRHGFVWVPGHWEGNGRRHFWVQGTWLRERPGFRYAEPAWVQQDGRWVMERGHWERGDRDHDGIPNRYDHHPNNPYRY